MLTESAVVIGYDAGIAMVRCQSQSACGSCVDSKGCGTSVLSDLAGEKGRHYLQVESLTPLKIGQKVQIGLEEKSLIFTALLMYVVPLVALLLSTLLATIWVENELIVAGIDFVATAIGFVVVKQYAKRIIQQSAYKPILLRLL